MNNFGKSNRALQYVIAAILTLIVGTQVPLVHADTPAPTVAEARFEVSFMEEMIDHHAMAIMMSTMCQERATHPKLLELCNQMKTAQMEEIEMMTSWLASWYDITYPPQMTAGQMKQMEKMAALSGAEFEIEFMRRMIRHHWKAVIRSSRCIDQAYHPELVELCQNMVLAQSAEISQMQSWLCGWYGICNYGPKSANNETDE